MNTRILKHITAIVTVLFVAITAIAQDKTMYVMKNGSVVYQSTVAAIDSIVFETPEQIARPPQTISGTISENFTFVDLGLEIDYIVTGWGVTFNKNVLVTINPGVCIAFQRNDTYMNITDGATIKMLGTAEKPIKFCGAAAESGSEKGSWGYVEITTNSDNVMQYVEFINGGSRTNDGVVQVSGSGQLSMNNCKINGSLGMGLSTSSGAVLKKFADNVIENCNKEPVYLGHISQAGAFDETSTLTNNVNKFISITSGTLANADLTINPTTVPYYFLSWNNINKVLTVNAGTKFLMNTNAYMSVGNIGCLKMLGTAEKPILVEGYTNSTERGSWGYFEIGTNNDNQFQYVEFINGGSRTNDGVVQVSGSGQLSMNNCKINGSLGMGLSTSSGAVLKKFAGNVIENCNNEPVYLGHISQAGAFDETSTLTNNVNKFISITSGTLANADLTINPTTVPYHFLSWNNINKALTVKAGTKFLMNTNAYMSVGNIGCLKMQGTAEKPILVEGYMNSTEKGSWQYIEIATNNDNQLQYVEMVNGGSDANYGVLRVAGSGKVSMDNCKINGSKGYGISTSSGANLALFTNNTITNCNMSPVWLGHISQTAAFDMTSTLTGNIDDYIGITSGTLSNADLTTKSTTVPYYLSSWNNIDKVWTINGATFYFHTDAYIDVRNLGRINATNCKFSNLPNMGYQYQSIWLSSSNGSSFTNCTFEKGAKATDSGIVSIEEEGEFTFNSCTFQNTSEFGVLINDTKAVIKHDGNNTFIDCTKGNILDTRTNPDRILDNFQ